MRDADRHPVIKAYDRQLLLFGSKRNQVLDLSEVKRYGNDCYGDADYVSIYGLPPSAWHEKGIRLLGRTAVECTRDKLADAIGCEAFRLASAPVICSAWPTCTRRR